MRILHTSVRHRVLGACLVVVVGGAAALGILGFRLRQILRDRAREGCVRMASVFEGVIHARLIDLVSESSTIADVLGRGERPLSAGVSGALPRPGPTSLVRSWAVYDATGRRIAARRDAAAAELFDRLGVGAAQLPTRERARVADAATGANATVLVPGGEAVFALHYMRIDGPDDPPLVLQTATSADSSILPDSWGVRAGLVPFASVSEEPRIIDVRREPHLVVHRPLSCGSRQLATVVVSLPYGEELRCDRMVAIAIFSIAALAILVLALVSHKLAKVAMAPIERTTALLRRVREGSLVELGAAAVPTDETGALVETCQHNLKQAQEWVDRLMASTRAFRELFTGAAGALVCAIEAKDEYTAGHSERVAELACRLARHLGWDEAAIEELRIGATLHDIGKIGVRGAIINKPRGLTDEEKGAVREHPAIGARILENMPDCEQILHIILHHHERYDGTGYPAGLAGQDIPTGARIVAIADVYDALTSERSYRGAHTAHEALAILEANRGTMFDPEFLDLFLHAVVGNAEERCAPAHVAADAQPSPARGSIA